MTLMDLMCSNYVRAAKNREMVRLNLFISGYLEIEAMVRNWPHKKRLPDRLIGVLPSIGRAGKSTLGQYGVHMVLGERLSGVVEDSYISNLPLQYRSVVISDDTGVLYASSEVDDG